MSSVLGNTPEQMQLLGSTTSPYVRRIRLLLAERNYRFVNLDIFSDEHRSLLTQSNPAKRVPALIDGEQTIIDSGVIYRYLAEKFEIAPLSWHQQNLLAQIDAVNDSMVSMLILSRSDIDTSQDKLFFNLQRERANTVFSALDAAAEVGDFEQWHYVTMALYCLLDWLKFRELFDWQAFPHLVKVYQAFNQNNDVLNTDPRS
ncbi:glutathione S-transferase family protein [Thalassotalea fusca]